ncbi:MAG: DUF5132 domain-containing protein [Methylobacter sp.]
MKIDDLFKNGVPLGIAIGVGATVIAKVVIPILPDLARAARPGVREALKSGILLIEQGRGILAEVGEEFEDILAEARSELQQNNDVSQPEAPEPSEAPEPIESASDQGES